MKIQDNKYKDALPKDTLACIKKSLSDMGLKAEAYYAKNSMENFYSLSLKIEGTSISVNGKGTTKEYAEASAYAELMERLQNQSFFRLNGELSQKVMDQHGFYYAPDETYKTIPELMEESNEWLRSQTHYIDRSELHHLLHEWKGIYGYKIKKDFVCLPYMNLMTNRVSQIPVNMVSKMYMSNGMCAGNTKEEAIVQGLSEVLERVVNTRLIEEYITPPDIPDVYLQKYPYVYQMVETIRGIEGAKLVVKDCSLGRGYPVVGIILMNTFDQTYFVKFGSHPCFEIALERCLTELLQGQDIWDMKGMQEFKLYPDIHDAHQNVIGILVNGVGSYPYQLFSKRPSYPFKPYANNEGKTNAELLEWMLNLLRQERKEVYVRDVSFTPFKAYSVIVPHFSEIEALTDRKSINDYSDFVRVKGMIRNLWSLDEGDIRYVLDYLKKYKLRGDMSILKLLGVPCEQVNLCHYANVDLLKGLMYYKIGDYKRAYYCFNDYVSDLRGKVSEESYQQYKCARDYIGTKADRMGDYEQYELLKQFYTHEMITQMEQLFANPQEILNYYGTIQCFNCERCCMKEKCQYKAFEDVYCRVKEWYKKGHLDQECLRGTYRGSYRRKR